MVRLMLDVRRLRFLVELNRRGTIAAVSEALHMSPSGISHQLSLLEREAGTALLERVGRGVRLTDAGLRLAERGADVLAALELAETEARSGQATPTGTCRVAAFGSAAKTLVPALVESQRRHPGLRIDLIESEPEVALPALMSGDFDLVVSEEYPGAEPSLPRHVERKVLAQDPLEVVVAEELLDGRPLARAGGSMPWALEPVGASSRAWSIQHCRGLGFTPSVHYVSTDLDLLLRLVAEGAAASVLPRLALSEGREDTLGLRRIDSGSARTLVSLIRRARSADSTVRTVEEALRSTFDSATKGQSE